MKQNKYIFLLLAVFMLTAPRALADVEINSTNFPDANFRSYICTLTGVAEGGTLTTAKCSAVTKISCYNKSISSLKGIEYFTAINTLMCYGNQLTSLDVSKNTELSLLYCYNNQLTSLDVSKNTKLSTFDCSSNQLTSLNVNHNSCFNYFLCFNNKLTSLDLSGCNLIKFSCYNNQISSLDLSKDTALTLLVCNNNRLTTLDLSHNTKLTDLRCHNNQITSLDLSNKTDLSIVFCQDNQLTSLNVSNDTALNILCCYNNQITSFDVSNSLEIEYLVCNDNQLATLDLSNNTKLKYLACENNQLTTLDLSENVALSNDTISPQRKSVTATINNGKFSVSIPGISSSNTEITSPNSGVTVGDSAITIDPTAMPDSITYNFTTGNTTLDNAKTMSVILMVTYPEIAIEGIVYPGDAEHAYEVTTLPPFLEEQKSHPNAILVTSSNYADVAATATNVVVNYAVGASNNHYYECPNFVLTEPTELDSKYDFYTPVSFTASTGSYSRTFSNKYSTCCLPFALSTADIDADAKFLTFAYYRNDANDQATVYFNANATLDAGTPCFIYNPAHASLNVEFSNTNIVSTPDNSGNLMGTFIAKDFTGYFGINPSGSGFMPDGEIAQFRSALTLNYSEDIGGGGSAVPAKIVILDGNTTGASDVNSVKAISSIRYYNVAGYESNVPFDGVNFIVTRYTDGSVSTCKLIK